MPDDNGAEAVPGPESLEETQDERPMGTAMAVAAKILYGIDYP